MRTTAKLSAVVRILDRPGRPRRTAACGRDCAARSHAGPAALREEVGELNDDTITPAVSFDFLVMVCRCASRARSARCSPPGQPAGERPGSVRRSRRRHPRPATPPNPSRWPSSEPSWLSGRATSSWWQAAICGRRSAGRTATSIRSLSSCARLRNEYLVATTQVVDPDRRIDQHQAPLRSRAGGDVAPP